MMTRALTVRQPWAELIASGTKPVENRRKPFQHRGRLAIHAGRSWASKAEWNPRVVDALAPGYDPPLEEGYAREVLHMQFGVVIAVAELVDCHLDVGCCLPWGEPGMQHLVLTDVRRLAVPMPATGQLGMWHVELPPEVA